MGWVCRESFREIHVLILTLPVVESVEVAVSWATNTTCKGIALVSHLVDAIYEKGIKVLPEELEQYHPLPFSF